MTNYDRLQSHRPNLRRKLLPEGVGYNAPEGHPEQVGSRRISR